MHITFTTANFVGRQLGYRITQGWGQGEAATEAYFAPIDTFRERFDELMAEVKAMGFDALDLWVAHLHWRWATERHIADAVEVLRKHGLRISSLAGGFGTTREEFVAACKLANALGTSILGGMAPILKSDRPFVEGMLEDANLVLGVENHPEKTPAEMLEQLGPEIHPRIGTTLDTGWYGTQGFNAVDAIHQLRRHIVLVHLKDVREAGAHRTCAYGDGIVPVRECVAALVEVGYQGDLTIEHEPDEYDPRSEIVAGRRRLERWLDGAAS